MSALSDNLADAKTLLLRAMHCEGMKVAQFKKLQTIVGKLETLQAEVRRQA